MSQRLRESLRTMLAQEGMVENELPDGSDLTVPKQDVPNDVEEEVFDDIDTLALESDINIDERLYEMLVADGEILSDIDLALEAFRLSGFEMDDITYATVCKTYNRIAEVGRLPSIESMIEIVEGNRKELHLATEAAVVDKMKDVIKKVLDIIVKLFQRIKDWYIRVFDKAAREHRRALKVVKASQSLGGAPLESTLTMTNVATIGIKNRAVDPGNFLNHLDKIEVLNRKYLTDVSRDYSGLLRELSTLTKQQVSKVLESNKTRNDETLSTSANSVEVPKVSEEGNDQLQNNFIEHFKRMVDRLGLTDTPPENDPRFSVPNTIYHISKVLPGNMFMTSAVPDKSDEVVSDLGKIKNSFGVGVVAVMDQPNAPKVDKEVSFDTLTLIDIQRFAQYCITLCKSVTEYRLVYSEIEKRTDGFLKDVSGFARTGDELDATARRDITSIVTGATSIQKNMMNGESRWVKYVMDLVTGVLDWCIESMKQYDHGKPSK